MKSLWSTLALLYVLLQVLLPMFVLARPGRTWRDFSWDMFSHRLSCPVLEASMTVAGRVTPVPLARDFGNWAQLSRILVPGRVEQYASYLCPRLRMEHGADVQLHFATRCQDSPGGAFSSLVDPERDYCRH